MLICAVLAVASGRTLIVAVLLVIPAIAGRWINHFRPDLVSPAVFLSGGLVVVAFVVVNLLRFILRAPSVTIEVLCASISAYLLLGLMWTMAYWLVDQLTPGGAFSFNTNVGPRSMDAFNAFWSPSIRLRNLMIPGAIQDFHAVIILLFDCLRFHARNNCIFKRHRCYSPKVL